MFKKQLNKNKHKLQRNEIKVYGYTNINYIINMISVKENKARNTIIKNEELILDNIKFEIEEIIYDNCIK